MNSTRKAGSNADDASKAATFGGPTWRLRQSSHVEEVTGGKLWRPYQVSSEVAQLKAVLLAWPGDELAHVSAPDEMLMLAPVHLQTMRSQMKAVAEFYRSRGVEVHVSQPATPPPPNYIFMRDLFFMTPEGAILGRPAAVQRAGEERYAAETLACLGVPLLTSMRGRSTFEGADALWLDRKTVLVGIGRRTNVEAYETLETQLDALGVHTRSVPMPEGVQHLLGVLNFIDEDLAVLHGGKAPVALMQLLESCGVEPLTLPTDDELVIGRGMNFVTLGPREVVMPDGCPGIQQRLTEKGVSVHTLEVGEYLKAAGALGCLTGVLSRANPDSA